MFDFYEKRKIRSFLYSKVFIFCILLATIFLSISVHNRYTVASEMHEKLEKRKAELEELKGRAALLESKVEYMKDERGIEEEIRSRFDVAKEGEQVIILLDEEKKEKIIATSSDTRNEPVTNEEKSFFDRLIFWQ